MECRRVQHLLPVFQGKLLGPAEAEEVRRHLDGCPTCLGEDSFFSATWRLLDALPEIGPSPTFRARFWEKARKGEKNRSRWRDFLEVRWMPVAAGVLAIWIVGVIGGVALYDARSDGEAATSADAVYIFTSPYPVNSIEAAYLGGGNEERHHP